MARKPVEAHKTVLSAREKEVLNWLKQGKSSWDVSVILDISERTVNYHVYNIMRKLEAVNRPQALAAAARLGLIDISASRLEEGNMRLSKAVPAVLFVLSAFPFTGYATESGSLSCTNGIVSIGDTAGEVRSKCGEPAFTSQREQKEVAEESKGFRKFVKTTVTIEDWTFNFGPNQFQYQIILENGRVAKIESLDYGY